MVCATTQRTAVGPVMATHVAPRLVAFVVLALLAGVLSAPTPAKKEIAMLFSGGGVRATFGTLVAACELKKVGVLGSGTYVNEVAGLSGGAWGVAMLSMSDDQGNQLDPCQKIKDIEAAVAGGGEWGKFNDFHHFKCGRTDSTDDTVKSCFKE
jgi:hypothetical protein